MSQAAKIESEILTNNFLKFCLCANQSKFLLRLLEIVSDISSKKKCPHAKQVAPCQDLEKCADGGGWGAVLIDLAICTLLNSPSSLHGVSLMEI